MNQAEYIVDPIYGCWLWQGKKFRDGYAAHYGPDGTKMGHRWMWEQLRGEIPKGKFLDHRCRRRDCVRPSHLEVVDQSTNERRKSWRARARMKACPKGHDAYLNGRRTPEGGLVCRACDGDNVG